MLPILSEIGRAFLSLDTAEEKKIDISPKLEGGTTAARFFRRNFRTRLGAFFRAPV